ncbi:hypothetical protein RRG08_007157 [Elysia crispata]|uniref:Uncharacterized protein n=1 Tax=Elysia crispata TaxID=231223 RepID=A0AAE1CZ62_9GAST|nr:hypothetical protein RRG08_007157 [Elysia crispata]
MGCTTTATHKTAPLSGAPVGGPLAKLASGFVAPIHESITRNRAKAEPGYPYLTICIKAEDEKILALSQEPKESENDTNTS